MTTSSNDPSGPSAADRPETASSPGSDSGDSAEVTSTGGMAAGSQGSGGEPGFIDDNQLPEELRPDAEGMAGDDASEQPSLADGATEETGQLVDQPQRSAGDEPPVSEPTG
jgi:hypothetical protein